MSSKTGCPEGTLYNLCPQMLSRLNWIKTCPAWETDTALTRQLDKRPSGVPSSLNDPILDSVQYYIVLLQVIGKPIEKRTIPNLILTNKEGLMENVKLNSSLAAVTMKWCTPGS